MLENKQEDKSEEFKGDATMPNELMIMDIERKINDNSGSDWIAKTASALAKDLIRSATQLKFIMEVM